MDEYEMDIDGARCSAASGLEFMSELQTIAFHAR